MSLVLTCEVFAMVSFLFSHSVHSQSLFSQVESIGAQHKNFCVGQAVVQSANKLRHECRNYAWF